MPIMAPTNTWAKLAALAPALDPSNVDQDSMPVFAPGTKLMAGKGETPGLPGYDSSGPPMPTASIGSQDTPSVNYDFKKALAGTPQKQLKGSENEQIKSQNNDVHTRYTYKTPEQIVEEQQAWMDTPMGKSVQEGTDKLQNMLDMQQKMGEQQSHLNLAPLLAEADRSSPNEGSHLAAAYTPPPSQMEAAKGLIDLQEKLQQRKDDIFKTLSTAAKGDKSGVDTNNLIQALTQANQFGFQPPPNPKTAAPPSAGNFLTWTGQIKSDKDLGDLKKTLTGTDSIANLLTTNNPSANVLAQMKLIGLEGFKRFNENEINRQLSPALYDKMSQLWQSASEGNMTPQNIQQMRDTIKQMHDEGIPLLNQMIAAHGAGGEGAGLDHSKIQAVLNQYRYNSPKQGGVGAAPKAPVAAPIPAGAPTGGPPPNMSLKEFTKWKREHGQ